MDVQAITMDPDEAREQLRAYRRALHRRADAEYRAVERGLRELAEGRAIISLRQAINEAPFDSRGRPMLAIARADQQQVEIAPHPARGWDPDARTWRARGVRYNTKLSNRGVTGFDQVIDVGLDEERPIARGFALVPMIPPAVREASGVAAYRDREHMILWEVEEWSGSMVGAAPDRDPILLRRLGGDAYVVLAAWDLTPLEQFVMRGRAPS